MMVMVVGGVAGCGGVADPPPTPSGPSPASSRPTDPPVPPSFELACDGATSLVMPARAYVSCTITPRDGFKGTVTLGCANEPAFVECGFDPALVDIAGTDRRAVTLGFRQMNLKASPGQYTVNATAQAGDLKRSADVGLTIPEGCAGYTSQPSYTACASRPSGTFCIQFSDGYVWLARRGTVLGWGEAVCDGRPIEIAMTGAGDVRHVLGTDLTFVNR
jgi:hypothetical protein